VGEYGYAMIERAESQQGGTAEHLVVETRFDVARLLRHALNLPQRATKRQNFNIGLELSLGEGIKPMHDEDIEYLWNSFQEQGTFPIDIYAVFRTMGPPTLVKKRLCLPRETFFSLLKGRSYSTKIQENGFSLPIASRYDIFFRFRESLGDTGDVWNGEKPDYHLNVEEPLRAIHPRFAHQS
jgi:hypothetical protein